MAAISMHQAAEVMEKEIEDPLNSLHGRQLEGRVEQEGRMEGKEMEALGTGALEAKEVGNATIA